MFFCSGQFLLFFAVVFCVYWALPWGRARVWWLLVASFAFYASWSRELALIVAASTVADYWIARFMDASESPRRRFLLMLLSVSGNLGLLCYFKYANFFLASLEQALRAGGCHASVPLLQVVLPIGISFYTFEAISYTIDVYRRRIKAEQCLSHFMLFVLFFPHLVAGPIVRGRDFLPQIAREKRFNWSRCLLGAQFILLGVFKKLVIADRMAHYVDPIFAAPGFYSGQAALVAVLAYSVQIYCDFSGYTDMALGSAHMLGYKLAPNFNMPYLAASMSEFWRRWHISLSTWLRDYLFIPLGGSRGGFWLTARNLMITMTLGGLWHGAGWPFIAWGAMHGLLLVVDRLLSGPRERLEAFRLLGTSPARVLGVLTTFGCVTAGWVFFRATTFRDAVQVFRQIGRWSAGLPAPRDMEPFLVLAGLAFVCHLLPARQLWRWAAQRLPAPALGAALGVALAATLLLAPEAGEKVFIYFQF